MQQLTQSLKTGQVRVHEIPRPVVRPEGLLVRSEVSLISAGTERMMLNLAKKSLLGKARERPDLVKKVLAKVRRDGFWATFRIVRDRLDSAVPLGYSVAGTVLEVGAKAGAFAVGERVACAGAGYANHAEVNYIPRLLAVRTPEAVSAEAAAYTTVGTIALQGVRNADMRVGETVAVLGLGLIGQLAVQILKASGCRVVGLDVAGGRVEKAVAEGADLAVCLQDQDAEKKVLEFTRGRGADTVLITAATESNAPVELAARLARDRARVVMVGVTGMNIPRRSYFEKELTFLVSRSYGPGRYDREYEEAGRDYPVGYVRWTENRNMEAFLDLIASGGVRPESLTTHRFPIADAAAALELIMTNREPYLGVVLTYPAAEEVSSSEESSVEATRVPLVTTIASKPKDTVGASFVGAGGFARSILLPNLTKLPGVVMRGVTTASGLDSRTVGQKFGFAFCASSEADIHGDPETDLVFIATPHSHHAGAVCRALEAGKSVFVEKPLAITPEQLHEVCRTHEAHPQPLVVGFNRRFSPFAKELRAWIAGRGPLSIHYRCNAGPTPQDHWLANPEEGGRILGEACHFFDLFAYLVDSPVQTVYASAPSKQAIDDASVTIAYADGSSAQLVYTTSGPATVSKERMEVYAGGRAAILDDFKTLELHGESGRPRRLKSPVADKGHRGELAALIAAIRSGGQATIPFNSLIETTLLGLAALESLKRQSVVEIAEWRSRLFS